MKTVISSFIGWKLVVLLFALAASWWLPAVTLFSPQEEMLKFPYLLWIWSNFDGNIYVLIAKSSYKVGEQPYFPLYPWLIRTLGLFVSNIPHIVHAVVISNAAFLAALLIIWKLLDYDGYGKLKSLVILIILSFPTSMFYGAAYNDSLFLLLATLALLWARQKHWVASSLFGALAALTRLNGLALFFFITAEYFLSLKEEKKKLDVANFLRDKIYAVLLVPVGLIIQLINIQIIFGNWRQFFTAMGNWRSSLLITPFQVFYRYLKILVVASPHQLNYWVAAAELFSVILYVALLIWSYKKIRLSYTLFFGLSLLIPGLTGTFQGMPRYGLHLYPFFLALALAFARFPRWLKIVALVASLVGLFLVTALFTRGYFVA